MALRIAVVVALVALAIATGYFGGRWLLVRLRSERAAVPPSPVGPSSFTPPAPDPDALAAALERAGVPEARRLAALAEPALRITTRRVVGSELPLGASRFGGVPDVPAGFRWPARNGKPLTFLAQLDLSEAAAPPLPPAGWLLFFYDVADESWGFDPKDEGHARVIHFEGPREQLTRAAHPDAGEGGGPFELAALTFERTIDLPESSDSLLEHHRLEVAREHDDAYREIAARFAGVREGATYHHLLGHPQLIQNDMRGEAQLVTHGIYVGEPSGYQTERAKALLRTAAEDWRLLLQIDSDEEGPGWMWGDAGRIYFWIRHEHLAARRFDEAWLILQCY